MAEKRKNNLIELKEILDKIKVGKINEENYNKLDKILWPVLPYTPPFLSPLDGTFKKDAIDCMCSLYKETKDDIKNSLKNEPNNKRLKFMILANCGIAIDKSLSSRKYYRNRFTHEDLINKVELFVPWGGILSPSAAASILIGKAKPENMSYEFGESNKKADLYNAFGEKVERITSFNVLPKDRKKIPAIILKPTDEDESKVERIHEFMKTKKEKEDDVILVTYFNPKNKDGSKSFKYPEMPLHIVNDILCLILEMWNAEEVDHKFTTCDIQLLSNLQKDPEDQSSSVPVPLFNKNPVNVHQYYSVTPADEVEVVDHNITEMPEEALRALLYPILR